MFWKKTIYPPLGFHMKIEMPALDLAQNFVCSAQINMGNLRLNLSLQDSKHVECCFYPKIIKRLKKNQKKNQATYCDYFPIPTTVH